jgi:diguanylate cyclase (GGDEF)-like protein
LKKINDTYGHVKGGDKALQVLVDTLKQISRTEDILCRYAGDEFLIILYDTTAQAAYERALEWKEIVSKIKIKTDEGDFSITFSAGVAEYPLHGFTGEDILIRADQALYRAKELGRDRVVI